MHQPNDIITCIQTLDSEGVFQWLNHAAGHGPEAVWVFDGQGNSPVHAAILSWYQQDTQMDRQIAATILDAVLDYFSRYCPQVFAERNNAAHCPLLLALLCDCRSAVMHILRHVHPQQYAAALGELIDGGTYPVELAMRRRDWNMAVMFVAMGGHWRSAQLQDVALMANAGNAAPWVVTFLRALRLGNGDTPRSGPARLIAAILCNQRNRVQELVQIPFNRLCIEPLGWYYILSEALPDNDETCAVAIPYLLRHAALHSLMTVASWKRAPLSYQQCLRFVSRETLELQHVIGLIHIYFRAGYLDDAQGVLDWAELLYDGLLVSENVEDDNLPDNVMAEINGLRISPFLNPEWDHMEAFNNNQAGIHVFNFEEMEMLDNIFSEFLIDFYDGHQSQLCQQTIHLLPHQITTDDDDGIDTYFLAIRDLWDRALIGNDFEMQNFIIVHGMPGGTARQFFAHAITSDRLPTVHRMLRQRIDPSLTTDGDAIPARIINLGTLDDYILNQYVRNLSFAQDSLEVTINRDLAFSLLLIGYGARVSFIQNDGTAGDHNKLRNLCDLIAIEDDTFSDIQKRQQSLCIYFLTCLGASPVTIITRYLASDNPSPQLWEMTKCAVHGLIQCWDSIPISIFSLKKIFIKAQFGTDDHNLGLTQALLDLCGTQQGNAEFGPAINRFLASVETLRNQTVAPLLSQLRSHFFREPQYINTLILSAPEHTANLALNLLGADLPWHFIQNATVFGDNALRYDAPEGELCHWQNLLMRIHAWLAMSQLPNLFPQNDVIECIRLNIDWLDHDNAPEDDSDIDMGSVDGGSGDGGSGDDGSGDDIQMND